MNHSRVFREAEIVDAWEQRYKRLPSSFVDRSLVARFKCVGEEEKKGLLLPTEFRKAMLKRHSTGWYQVMLGLGELLDQCDRHMLDEADKPEDVVESFEGLMEKVRFVFKNGSYGDKTALRGAIEINFLDATAQTYGVYQDKPHPSLIVSELISEASAKKKKRKATTKKKATKKKTATKKKASKKGGAR
jgi:hypothetical protein